MKVALDSLGCKLNQSETELFARQLAEAGYQLVAAAEQADVYILNTCTVTHVADRKSRHLLRMARRHNPAVRLVATGCYAERTPQELRRIDGVDLVLGNAPKTELLRLLEESGLLSRPGSPAPHAASGHTRAMVKIQEGCRNYCSYCIVPLVRGEERSVDAQRVIGEVRRLAGDGIREVVLTGTRAGAYAYDGLGLEGLLRRILAETDIARLRLSSLQPPEISPSLLRLWTDGRLCPHFHLSLQSGSDSVLRRMQRRYSADDYRRAVALIREVIPDVAVTTDVIAGFPGETDAEFRQSLDFCRETGFARIHVFPYSPRRGTAAAQLPQVADGLRRRRSQQLLSLAGESAASFRERFLGRTLPVLWEKRSDDGVWSGLTGNYLRVYASGDGDLTSRLLPARLVSLKGDGVWGEQG